MAGRKPNKPKRTHASARYQRYKRNGMIRVAFYISFITLTCAIAYTVAAFLYIRDLAESRMANNLLQAMKEDEKSISKFDAQMRETNPDYLCWIKIDGTLIDYPVVRGNDNEKYLHTSFDGEENVFGALFMDYRCSGDYVPNMIIYGHNSRHRDMFGGLRNFLDDQYLAEHPVITLKVNDRVVEYEIFDARKTDITDPAYYLDFSAADSFPAFAERCGAPPDTTQIITLSTCVSGGNEDGRVIVQGVLR